MSGKQEQIVCAAIRIEWFDGYNKRSTNLLGVNYKHIRNDEVYEMFVDDYKFSSEVDGFITSKNRFVDQIEAADIALSADQLPEVNKLWDLFAEKKREKDRSGVQEMIYNKTSKISEVGIRPEDLY